MGPDRAFAVRDRPRLGWGLLLVGTVLLTGCQGSRSWLAWAKPTGWGAKNPQNIADLQVGSARLAPLEGLEELEAAKAQYERGEYAAAEKAFRKIAKKYRDKPVDEDAGFYIAECLFAQQQYPAAEDAFGELFKKHPTTRYIDRSSQRLWTIAHHWLGEVPPVSEVELVQFTPHGADRTDLDRQQQIPYVFPLTPNLFDKTRPFLDTRGRALQALKSIWLHDPTGPLADDALMITATYHLRRGDLLEADRLFGILREEYPQSEHAAAAYVIGSHVKLASYQGPAYDGKHLEEAAKLTQSAVRLFPEIPQQPKLREDLSKIQVQAAERDWEKVQLYRRKGDPRAAAIYAELLIQQHPQSPYADLARGTLRELGPEYEAGFLRNPQYRDVSIAADEPPPPVAVEPRHERQ